MASPSGASPAGESGAGSAGGAGGAGAGGGGEAARVQHPRSFKLRFAAPREPGRSYVSPVKPLGLPDTVTGKFYSRVEPGGDAWGEARALRRIRAMFACGPRERLAAPRTTAHDYGWWPPSASASAAPDRRLHHHIHDSPWLKARLQVLAEDVRLRQK